jgi:hypothetical protein
MAALTPIDPLSLFSDLDPPLEESPGSSPDDPVRGVGWVLGWAGALTAMFASFVVLAEFGYQMSAEQTLARAARAGALEATLPRATYRSVEETIDRRLRSLVGRGAGRRIYISQNEKPVQAIVRQGEDDRFSVTLTLADQAVMPGWLNALRFWRPASTLEARAERRTPGSRIAAGP